MNYLTQYILESQAEYPSIFGSPFQVVSHLLYTNGNGVEFENGNPVVCVSCGRKIPFAEYYRQILTKEQILGFINENADQEISKIFRRREETNELWKGIKPERYLSSEELWADSVHEFYHRHDHVDWITNYTEENLINEDAVDRMLESSMRIKGFYEWVSLSRGYYIQEKFDGNTDPYLLRVGLTFSNVLIRYLNRLLEQKSEILAEKTELRNPFGKFNKEQLFSGIPRAIELLEEDIQQIQLLV